MYFSALDGLRGIAILLVMLSHANRDIAQAGWVGVEIFFILSGYLITASLLKSSSKVFYLKRAVRILPALFFFFSFYIIFAYIFDIKYDLKLIFSIFLFYSNWLFAFQVVSSDSHLIHLWSLAVEEQFYLFFPLLVKLFNKNGLIVFFIILFLYKIHYVLIGDNSRFYYGTDSRASSFVLGGIIFLYSEEIRSRLFLSKFTVEILLIFSLCILCGLSFFNFGQNTLIWLIFSNICMVVLIFFICEKGFLTYKIISMPFLLILGRLSFSLYLFHGFIFKYLKFEMNFVWWEVFMVGFPISLILSLVSYIFVEKPITKYVSRNYLNEEKNKKIKSI